MKIKFYLKLYALTIPIFFIIDIVWIGVVAQDFYQKYLGYILSPNVNWTAAIIFYLIYIVGIIIFGVRPAIIHNSFKHAIIFGGLFGFFTYATYDLTNLATVKNWPLIVTLIDMFWGTFLGASVAGSSFMVSRRIR